MADTGLTRPVDRATLARTREVRERVIARLSDEFAHDVLNVEEFERRVTVAQTSESLEEIEAQVRDLGPADPARAPAEPRAPAPYVAPPSRASAMVAAPDTGERETMLAIMGGIDRQGSWDVPRRLRMVMFMGGAHVDLREARFAPGITDLEIIAFMGGAEILVPPGLAVQTNGMGIMGGFSHINRAPANPDPDAPLLRIHGFAMMGGVDVKMRLPGESDRQARRRLKHQQRDERRRERALDRER